MKGEAVDEKQTTMATTAAMAVVVVCKKKGQEEQEVEDGEEEECSVCLNAIDNNDTDNPAGRSLVCGHRYHAFCLHF